MKQDETNLSIASNGELVYETTNGDIYDFLGFTSSVFGDSLVLQLRKD
jgi:hypothetical protein